MFELFEGGHERPVNERGRPARDQAERCRTRSNRVVLDADARMVTVLVGAAVLTSLLASVGAQETELKCDELHAVVRLNGGAYPGHTPHLLNKQEPEILLPRPAHDAHEVAAGRAMAVLYPEGQWVPGTLHLANGSVLDAQQLHALWKPTGNWNALEVAAPCAKPRLYYVPSPEFFAWPPVRAGHVASVYVDGGTRIVKLKTLAFAPAVFTADGFLSDEEAVYLRGVTREGDTFQSVVGINGELRKDHRRSRTLWLGAHEDPVVARVQARVGELLRINLRAAPGLAEDIQLVEYESGGKNGPHHDYYDTADGHVAAAGRAVAAWGRNRFATVIMYLNDVPPADGGTTNFPRAKGIDEELHTPCEGPTYDCSCGVNVQPRAGTALLFYNLEVAGHASPLAWGGARVDPFSLHIGCKLKRGHKFIATQWVHSWYGQVPPGGLQQSQAVMRTADEAAPLARVINLAEAPLERKDGERL